MAQPTDVNHKTSSTIDQSHPPEGDGVSLENLDAMILSEDPAFAKDLEEVNALPVDGSVDLEVVDLGVTDIEGTLSPNPADNPWRHPIGLRKFLVAVMPFLPGFWDWRFRQKSRLRFAQIQAKNYVKHLGPNLLKAMKHFFIALGGFFKGRIAAFGHLSRGLKLVAVVLFLASALTVVFIYRSYTHGVLPENQELIMASLEEWSGASYKYDAETEMDSFYDSPRTIQNIMSLPKMIVNIKPSQSSGTNPMAAMEFFLEGLSPEANVEVKDRESEIRDLFQRTMEDMTFDELDSPEGKQLLTEHLRQNLNNVLSKGKIRRVYIKEAVIKP
jgi:flagellar basal body-associated protein FliL